MKKIKMLETKLASPNGIVVEKYYKDEVYILNDNLYDIFKKNKWCKDFVEIQQETKKDKKEIKIKEEKQINEAPNNKMAEVPKNKKGK